MATGRASVRQCFNVGGQVPVLSIGAAYRLLAGVPPKVVASETGMSVRSAYRWKRDLCAVEVVEVDGWAAHFARFQRRPPVRISAWERRDG